MIPIDIWKQFTNQQDEYLGNIIKLSPAKSVCEVGSFIGSVSRTIWRNIKHTDKTLTMVDNLHFLPERLQDKFFAFIKKTVSSDPRVQTVLSDSKNYDFTQHEFVVHSHENIQHMKQDWEKIVKCKWGVLEISTNCFERTSFVLDAIRRDEITPRYYINGVLVFGDPTPCDLPVQKGELLGRPVMFAPKREGTYTDAVKRICKEFK